MSACKDSPNEFGDDFIPANDRYSFYLCDTTSASDSTYYNETYPEYKSLAEAIVIGKLDDMESSAIVRFPMSAPDSIKTMLQAGTINIKSCWVKMNALYYSGGKNSTFDFTVHRITDSIDVTYLTSSQFNNVSYEAADVSYSHFFDDTLATFGLNNSLITDWIMVQTSDSNNYPRNYGLMIKPTSSTNKMMSFLAYETSLGNAIKVYFEFEKPGVYTDTLSAYATADTYSASCSAPTNTENYMTLVGAVTYKNKIYFDMPDLPSNAVMNKATLELFLDSTKSYLSTAVDTSYDAGGAIINVGIITEKNTLTIDTTNVLYVSLSSLTPNKYLGDITAFIQQWINTGNNYGLILSIYGEEYDASKLVFYGTKYSVASLRPRLKIIYSLRNKE